MGFDIKAIDDKAGEWIDKHLGAFRRRYSRTDVENAYLAGFAAGIEHSTQYIEEALHDRDKHQ